jgi:hypothetical protein
MSKLVKDWFNRRAEDSYTFTDDSKRLFNWDKNRSAYSSYFIREDESLKTAAKMVGSMFRVIGVPKKTQFTNKSNMTTNSVQIPLGMLRDESGAYLNNDPELLDAFYGSAIQNAALATMQTGSDYNKTLRARDTSKNLTVKDMLFSVLNTERIDKKLSDRFPGYLKFVQKFKNHKYENAEAIAEDAPDQARLMDLVVKLLRYPADIKDEDLEEFEKPVKSIERLLKKHGGIPETADDCASMATSLSSIIYKYVKEEEEEEKEPGPGDDDSGGDGSDEAPPKAPSKPSMDRKELDEMAKSMVKNLVNADNDDLSDSDFAGEFEDFKEDMTQDESPRMLSKDWDKEGEADSNNVSFVKAGVNKVRYKAALEKVDTTKAAVLQKLFQRKSKDQAFVIKSMRSGRLDTNKIAEASQNVPTIYERMGHISTNKICVGVLVDESGSMGGSKIDKAREAAIFINEVFKKMPDVDLYIYGHTADEKGSKNTNMRIYRERKYVTDPYALGDISARSNNRDGDAILAAAKRIRMHTKDQGLLFVISDGAPSAYDYSGRSAIQDTRQKVTKAQSLGFQVIQIAIEEYVPSSEMFDYYVKMTDIKNLPKDLIGYMSRKVDKLIKETVTV